MMPRSPTIRTGALGRAVVARVCGIGSIVVLAAGCRTDPATTGELAKAAPTAPLPAATKAPPPEVSGPLTFDTAVARARALSEEIDVLRAAARVARTRIRAACDLDDPEVRVDYGDDNRGSSRSRWSYELPLDASPPTTATAPPGDPPDSMVPAGRSGGFGYEDGDAYSISLRLFPPNPWVLAAQVSLESAAYRAAVEELRAAELAVAVEVRRHFVELAYLEQDVAEIHKLAELRQALRETLQERADQGLATLEDTADASRRYLNVLANLAATRQQRDQVRSELALLIRIPADAIAFDAAALPVSDLAYIKSRYASLAQEAIGSSAEISARAWEVKVARAAHRQACSQRLPWFNHVQAAYSSWSENSASRSYGASAGTPSELTATDYDFTTDSGDGREWTISTAVSLPVFSWLNSLSTVRRAEVRLAETRHEATKSRIESRLERALETADIRLTGLNDYGKSVRPVAEELEALLARADGPDAPLDTSRALRIREELTEARRTALELRYNYHSALTDLEEALGLGFAIQGGE